ncbi:subtilase family protein [Modicisalibacter xianhensis]|uniref:Subtilase family protein n=1 Tax=Modicisalibacter xianhensis TaxID=442341 RepID=A0A4R8FXQ3_9GAMM|nr:S8 family serine peptidase [Halomonas xianhensis]TDX30400.1 subtilase family protein [Halomonas xianhensis]
MFFPKHPLTLALSLIVSSLAVSGCSSGGGGGSSAHNDAGRHDPVLEWAPPVKESSGTLDSDGNATLPVLSGEAVLVGIADAGFRVTHEALSGSKRATVNLYDPSSSGVSTNADHGTAVASLVAGGPGDADLILAKVNDDTSSVTDSRLLDYSVGFLADQGARVINQSYSHRLEAPSSTATYQGVNLLNSLKQITTSNAGKGTVYVVAAANDGKPLTATNPVHQYSGIFERMLIVGGTVGEDAQLKAHASSNHPGEDAQWQSRFLTAPWQAKAAIATSDTSYAIWHGTSVAAPVVSAYAAAIMQLWPHLDAKQVSALLLDTASKSSDLYRQNTCGAAGTTNCGVYYLGQGEADIQAALSPQGELSVPTGDRVEGESHTASQSVAQLSGAFGQALADSGALSDVAMFDDLGRDYRIDLSGHVAAQSSRSEDMRLAMGRMAGASMQARSVVETGGTQSGFMARFDMSGEGVASRFDGQLGRSHWTSFQYRGGETSPVGPFAEAGFMPMLSFQGGSAFTRHLDSVTGLESRYALTEALSLTAGHWQGDSERQQALSDYAVERTDLGLNYALTDDLTLSAGAGLVQEENGLLGAQGSGAFDLGEENRLTLGRVGLDYAFGDRWSGFASYERGHGDSVPGDGLIERIDNLRAEEMALGMQWRGDRHQAALTLKQPLRLDDATATLDVPVGRTLDGQVVRETRRVPLAPSGQQRDIELGYAFQQDLLTQWRLNLLYTLEPGHDRGADSEMATLLNYSRTF